MIITKIIYEQIESCLKELSDIAFQERVWVRGEGPEVSSYTEVVCQLFDDTGIGDELCLEQHDGYVISKDIDPMLHELSDLLDSINSNLDTQEILKSPNWEEIRSCASHALKLLKKEKGSRLIGIDFCRVINALLRMC